MSHIIEDNGNEKDLNEENNGKKGACLTELLHKYYAINELIKEV